MTDTKTQTTKNPNQYITLKHFTPFEMHLTEALENIIHLAREYRHYDSHISKSALDEIAITAAKALRGS